MLCKVNQETQCERKHSANQVKQGDQVKRVARLKQINRAKHAEQTKAANQASQAQRAESLSANTQTLSFTPLSPKLALQLAAPHTWPASIMPAFVATAAALSMKGSISVVLTLVLLLICVLMQSSVNTFNDYFDYVKGADSADDNVEVSDATLVYNNVKPQHALMLAIGFLAVAFALGLAVIYSAGLAPLVIAIIGALFVVLYSGGKTPISYLPIGEFVSGFVMGGLIPLAVYQVLTGKLEFRMLLWALPEMLGVALIMFTNNQCDIEKDEAVGRKTMPVCLGRKRARRLYSILLALWVLGILILLAIFFPNGLIVAPFMLLAAYPSLKALFGNPLLPSSRIAAMKQICSMNLLLGSFYAASLLASGYSLLL